MTRLRLLLFVGVAVLILLFVGVGAGVWWYLFGANPVAAAELVPADTIAFATIPNGVTIVTGYQASQLKTLVDSPNAKPLIDSITNLIGQKNADLIQAFLPSLSGQSFIALTHFDADKPGQTGFIAAMKPKAGLDDFDAFVEKLKTSWPDFMKTATTGTGNVAGVDYQWIKGPGATDKFCVAQFNGWIVTTWGEAPLQDWVERLQKKSATPSLAQNPDYQKSLTRVGKDPMALLYINYHTFLDLLQKQLAKANPTAGDYLAKKLAAVGGAMVATRFENGDIIDRFSMLMPRQAQLDSGMASAPCPFDTLKFTGPDTQLYWATSVNWQQYWKNLQEQASLAPSPNPILNPVINSLQTWAQSTGLDFQRNIINPLGPEFSIQMDWSADTTYPEVGLFLKVDKPDDFKPTIDAIITSTRKAFENSAVIKEIVSNNQTFAALKFIQSSPISPTITEDGPYFGLFLTENQAARAFGRDTTINLLHNVDFNRQIGDQRTGASQILFIDSPRLLNRGYTTAMPYLSLISMFNKQLAEMLKGKTLPDDLTWLAPIGTWSFVTTPDDDGVQGYSVSGIGNQGIFLLGGLGAGAGVAQSMGMLPKMAPANPYSSSSAYPPPPSPYPATNNIAPPAPLPSEATNSTPVAPAPAAPAAPPMPAPSPDTNSNVNPTPAPTDTATNAAPAPPDASTNTPPATPAPVIEPAPATNAAPSSTPDSSPATNSTPHATSPTPDAKTE